MYPELRHGWAALRAFRSEEWKVVKAPEPEIFHLPTDPGETENLHSDPAVRAELAGLFAELASERFDLAPPGAESVDPEVEAALRSLGYAAPAPRGEEGREAPDPKERIRLERLLGSAASALESGNLAAARAAISRALSVDPRNKETQILLARLEASSGNFDRAFEVFRWSLGLPPKSTDAIVHYEAGRVALDAGRLELAEASFARSVEEDPLNVDALFNWGVAAYRQGRFRDAAARWRDALRLDPRHAPATRWLPDAEEKIASETRP
jgi:tetratricopeptide (TPR) repeat protein